MNRKDSALLRKLGACEDARAWCKSAPNLRAAWDNCQRSDWMLWALDHVGFRDDKKLRLYACGCVRGTPLADGRTLWDLLTDERSRHAVEVAERYAKGAASDNERDAAWAAAGAWQANLLRQWISWDEIEAAIAAHGRAA